MAPELRIAVLDDDLEELERVRQALNSLNETGAEYFTDAPALLAAAKRAPFFDLAFLDVYLQDGTGIEAAKSLREIDPETDLVFITASREHAVDAFSLGALHYLVKPVTAAGVAETLRRREAHAAARRSITLVVNRQLHRVYLDSIVSVQSIRHLVEVRLTDGRCLRVWQPISEIERLLDADFLKINRGVIVNMNEITSMDLETCSLSDGSVLPVKQTDRALIRKQYSDFLFHELHLMTASKRGDRK